jgi:hypothetical protein
MILVANLGWGVLHQGGSGAATAHPAAAPTGIPKTNYQASRAHARWKEFVLVAAGLIGFGIAAYLIVKMVAS